MSSPYKKKPFISAALLGFLIPLIAVSEEFPSFDPSFGELPESVTRDSDGNTYASLSLKLAILRITPNGTSSEVFIPNDGLPDGALGALGVTFSETNRGVVVAIQGCGATGCSSANGVWGINRHGKTYRLPGTEQIPFPNDVTIDSRGNVYISDTVSGAIWISERVSWRHASRAFRQARMWIQDEKLLGTGFLEQGIPLGANGIVFSNKFGRRGEILVANTEKASIYAVPINRRGYPKDIVLVTGGLCPESPLGGVCNPLLLVVDGIDVDRYGDIFAVTPIQFDATGAVPQSALYHIKRQTGEVQLVHVGEPMNLATDVVLGKNFVDAKTAFVANPGFLAPQFEMLPEPSIGRLELENSWFPRELP